MDEACQTYKNELHSELINILKYWQDNTLDNNYGGFVGKISHNNKIIPNANKGVILNTRILWSFSAASNYLKTKAYETICNKAFQYIKSYFKDYTNKGVYWELDYTGKAINKRKQVYAQAFAIYALSEYYMFSKNQEAKKWAIALFEILERFAKDVESGGYIEAFAEDWSPIADMRLSSKDMNAAKTMNTHLHVLEAYTNLLRIYENDTLKNSLKELVQIFQKKFLNTENHYDLFFDKDWNLMSNTISYGHDIETAWLVIDAVELLKDEHILKEVQHTAIKVADTFIAQAIDNEGAVINEKHLDSDTIDSDRHWWPQMEALVGLCYAYKLTNDRKYLQYSSSIWNFTKKHLIDHKNGEWYFRVDSSGKPYTEEDKVSMWKAPYHTSRSCIAINKLL